MKTKRANVASWLALLLGVLAATAFAQPPETTSARIARTKTLRIGAVGGAVPYFSKDIESGRWQGFGPDFAASLAAKFGAKVEFVETTWGNSVLDLQSHKIDAMFGLAPTPARREVIGFSDTLFDNTYTVVCRPGYPQKTWEQLNSPDVKVAVDVGSSHDQIATRVIPKSDLSRLENSGAATMALQSGRADCQVLVIILAETLLAKRPGIGAMFIPTPTQTNPVAIGLPKDADAAYQKAVNEWVDAVRAKGEVRNVIVNNMVKLVGVKPDAFPKEVKF